MKNTPGILALLNHVDRQQLIQTIERGIEMEKLEKEILPADGREIQNRITNSTVFLSYLYASDWDERRRENS